MQKYFEAVDSSLITRRNMLTMTGTLAAGLALSAALPGSKALAAASAGGHRTLSFLHLHTGEKGRVTYWENGQYVRGALAEINRLLRDFRTGDLAQMDPNLLNSLYTLHHSLGSKEPFQIISAYRSPKSNAMLSARSHGVAKKSMHLEGKAVDIRLSDRNLADVRKAALAMRNGGVGYYPASNFVHIDTGRVRQWS